MTQPQAHILPCGKRLHLQHGPIDLIIGAEGDRAAAFRAAQDRFATVLDELVSELPALRTPLTPDTARPNLQIAQRMDSATRPYCAQIFVTRMSAVAGAVADTILDAMCTNATLTKAYVNNGGDIALHLTKGHSFSTAMLGHDGTTLGQIKINYADPIRAIATSGMHGRSHSLGIADSVTVLAKTAAGADVAATLIANAVDLPNHPQIKRSRAAALDENSDLGDQMVVTHCAPLSESDKETALIAGLKTAEKFQYLNLINAAALYLQGQHLSTSTALISLPQRTPEYA